jgi:hypothetical protein
LFGRRFILFNSIALKIFLHNKIGDTMEHIREKSHEVGALSLRLLPYLAIPARAFFMEVYRMAKSKSRTLNFLLS